MGAELTSEDRDCISKLVISPGDKKMHVSEKAADQQWQTVDIKLSSGNRHVSTEKGEDVMLCRSPADEVITFVEGLEQLVERKRDEILFEPSEPSFEVSLARTRRGGIKVEAWLDAGNGTTGIYTWDACGVRFYTTDAHIRSFTQELKREFGLQ